MTDHPPDAATPSLFQTERHREIVGIAVEEGRVEGSELAARFGVTMETIRRDLSELQKQRLVQRVHGGAVPWETGAFEPLLSVRADLHDAEKRRMAHRAIDELPSSGSIIIDSGSTLTRLAEAIPQTCDLRIVTNSLLNAHVLAGHAFVDLIVVGGQVRKNTLAMVDADTVAAIEPLRVDTLFISSDSASPATGLTTPYPVEATLKQAMIRAARRVVALVDHSKMGHDQFTRFARWSDIDLLITNTELDRSVVAEIQQLGTTVALA